MNRILGIFVGTFVAATAVGCAVKRDTSRLEWYPHQPTAWVTTPKGHKRDAGPFASVQKGFVTEAQIDAAVDAGFDHFAEVFPQTQVDNRPIAINDDYAMFVPELKEWVSGAETTGKENLQVCMWYRREGPAEPPATLKPFIVRPPGEYWGVQYLFWRWTDLPLLPALEHELLHTVVGDPAHKKPEWKILEANPRK